MNCRVGLVFQCTLSWAVIDECLHRSTSVPNHFISNRWFHSGDDHPVLPKLRVNVARSSWCGWSEMLIFDNSTGISILPSRLRTNLLLLPPFAIFLAFVPTPKPRACPAGRLRDKRPRSSPFRNTCSNTSPSTRLCRPDLFRLPAAPPLNPAPPLSL